MIAVTIMGAGHSGYWWAKTVATILGVRESTVRGWVQNQRLPAVKFYGVYLITNEGLRSFVTHYYPDNKPWGWVESVLEEIFPEGIHLFSWSDCLVGIFSGGTDLSFSYEGCLYLGAGSLFFL